jgi:hypothetical protein
MRPSVDVHVPNRDYGRWLPACLDSVLTQDGVDVRVVVVDNASKDDSVAVVEAYAERDRRVSLVRHAQDQGLIASLSEGLAWCSAEYTVNLSADDRLTPGSLARATAFMAQRPDAGLVYGPAVLHREGTAEPRIVQRGPLPRTWSGSRWLAQVARTGKNPVFSPEALVRTGLAQEVGYSAELSLCPDFGMWLGLAARAPVGHLLGARQAVYRLHPTSMMQTQSWTASLESRWRACTLLVERDGARLDRPEVFLARTARALALEAVRTVELFTDWGRRSALPADEMLALAQRLWPQVVLTRAWTGCERSARRARRSPVRMGHLVGHKVHSDLRERLRRERGA